MYYWCNIAATAITGGGYEEVSDTTMLSVGGVRSSTRYTFCSPIESSIRILPPTTSRVTCEARSDAA